MRFDDPKVVVFLGIATVGVFSLVFAFSYLSPGLIQKVPVRFGYPKNLYPQVPSQSESAYQSIPETETSTISETAPQSPTLTNIPRPTIPQNFTTSISLNEDQLNQLISSAFKGNSNFSTPHITLSGDNVSLSLDLLSPVKGKVIANATIKTVNSQITIDLTQVKINSFPMPEFLVNIIENQLNGTLNGYLLKIPFLEIERVYVSQSLLTIEGKIPTQGLIPQ